MLIKNINRKITISYLPLYLAIPSSPPYQILFSSLPCLPQNTFLPQIENIAENITFKVKGLEA